MQLLELADNPIQAMAVGGALTCVVAGAVLIPPALGIRAWHWWKVKRGKYGRSA